MSKSYGTIPDRDEVPYFQFEVISTPNRNYQSFFNRNFLLRFVLLVGFLGFVTLFGLNLNHALDQKRFSNENLLRINYSDVPESSTSSSRRRITARTPLGRIRGKTLISRGGRDYYAFYAVPYGRIEQRFDPPLPALAWNNTRDGREFGPKCMQLSKINWTQPEGSEDCLHSNIFTPKLPPRFSFRRGTTTPNPGLPVLVYFFGGGFTRGTANDFLGDYFMDEDVVVVVVESRQGAFGFLNTEDGVVAGNMGLKDQSLSLSWVRDNIKSFGGDPTRVTAFGTSSGAMCAHAQILSPMSAGLMTGVMSFSGSMLVPDIRESWKKGVARSLVLDLGEKLSCPLESSTDLVACLRNATAEEIVLNQIPYGFGPSIERDEPNPFLPDEPWNLIKEGRVNPVPWVTGVNSAEHIMKAYGLLLNATKFEEMNTNWTKFAEEFLHIDPERNGTIDIEEIRQFYFGDEPISNETRYNLTDLLSDRSYVHSARTAALYHSNYSFSYLYYLSKEANVSFAGDLIKYFDPPYGVSHADEVQYFFPRPGYPYIHLDWSEYANFSQMIVKTIVSFAANGVPSGEVEWPRVEEASSGHVWLNFDDEVQLVEPFTERMEFWDEFPLDELYV